MISMEDRSDMLAEIHREHLPQAAPKSVRVTPAGPVHADDQKIIDKIMADDGAARLWSGNTAGFTSDSEADLSLIGRIAFFCNGDPSRIDSIFRQSSLVRDKWTDRPDYRERTISKALSSMTQFYDWNRRNGRNRPTGDTEAADELPIEPSYISIAEMARSHPALRQPEVEGLLRQGETMNIISAPKIGKSWLAIDLAIAKATGRMWLNQFTTRESPVLIIDNELHPQTIAQRIPKVASARGVLLSELSQSLFVESLRGRLRDIYQMDSYFRAIPPGKFGMIILDAFYRFLPRESDENSNADLASIYNQIDRYADITGSCIVCIHHSSKGVQSGKAVTDVGAGAGAQSRATDSHLILRAHEEDGAAVMEAAVRSWAPLKPVCLRWEFPIWKVAEDLDPTLLKQERPRRQRKEETPQDATPPAPEWTAARFVDQFITDDPQDKAVILARATTGTDLSQRKADNLLRMAEYESMAFRWEPTRKTQPVRYATTRQPITDAPTT
jgi:hypothetical protein